MNSLINVIFKNVFGICCLVSGAWYKDCLVSVQTFREEPGKQIDLLPKIRCDYIKNIVFSHFLDNKSVPALIVRNHVHLLKPSRNQRVEKKFVHKKNFLNSLLDSNHPTQLFPTVIKNKFLCRIFFLYHSQNQP